MTKNFASNFEIQDAVENIGQALNGKRNGKGGFDLCRCPAHDTDNGGNLSVDVGHNGDIVLHCYAGCGFERIRDALRGMNLWPEYDQARAMTPAEQVEAKHRREAAKAARDEAVRKEQETRHAEAAQRAQSILNAATLEPVEAHPYNRERGGRWTGDAKRGKWPQNGGHADAILLPIKNAAGELWSIQALCGPGQKYLLAGGAKAGHFFSFAPYAHASAATFYIGEGFFTVQASLAAALERDAQAYIKNAWIVAIDAGNLEPVASAIHAAHPAARIIILADEDGPGIIAANKAALAAGGKVARPSAGLPPGANIAKGYDFDNLYNEAGGQAVNTALRLARRPEPEHVKDAGEAAYQEQAQREEARADAAEEEKAKRRAEAQEMLAKIPAFDVWEALTVEPPPRPYILKGYLPTNIVALLAAQGGTGKSFLSLVIATAVASGRNIPPFEVESGPQNVLIVNAEDQAMDIRPRLYSIAKAYELTQGEMRAIAQNITVAPVRGIMGGLLKPGPHGTEPIETASAELLEMLIERHRPTLVILDTKSRLYGLKENAAEDGAAWISHLEKHLQAHPDTAFLVLTHTGKKSSAIMRTQDAERGSSANVDNSRGALVFFRVYKDEKSGEQLTTPDGAKVFCLKHAKGSYQEERPDVYFIRGFGGVPIMIEDPKRESEAAARLNLAKATGILCEALRNFPGYTLNLTQLEQRKGGAEYEEIRAEIKRETMLGSNDIGAIVAYGVEAGRLVTEKDATSKSHNPPRIIRLANPPDAEPKQGGLFSTAQE